MNSITKRIVFLCIAISMYTVQLHGEIFTRHFTGPYDFYSVDANWAASNRWTPTYNMSLSGSWPRVSGDIAHLIPGAQETNGFSNYQLYINGDFTVNDLMFSGSNSCLFTAYNNYSSPLLFFVTPDGSDSSLVYTNLQPIGTMGESRIRYMAFFQGITLVLSNDFHIQPTTAPNLSNYVANARINFSSLSAIYGLGNHVTVHGPTFMNIGSYAPGDEVWFVDMSELLFKGAAAFTFAEPYAHVKVPVKLMSYYDCDLDFNRSYFYLAGNTFDIDFTIDNAYILDWYANWPSRTNTGNIVVRDFALIHPYSSRYLELEGDVTGAATIYKGFNDTESGNVAFTGSISPGTSEHPVDYIYFYCPYSDGVLFGTRDDRVDFHIDITGLRDEFGVDADGIICENIMSIDLENIDLYINNAGYSNPYRTNEIMFSHDNAFAGWFNSVTWSDPARAGTIIPAIDSIKITDIPPLNSNFFDVVEYSLLLELGETQAFYTVRSPYDDVAVTARASENWVEIENAYTLTGAPAVRAVSVPPDLPATNSYGFSSATLFITARDDSNTAYNIPLYVVQPGYFELSGRYINHLENTDDSYTLTISSPLQADVNISVLEGSGWISVDTSFVSVTNDSQNLVITVSHPSAGSRGIIRIASASNTSLVHDISIYVYELGHFELSTTNLEFVVGQTQKFITASSPFVAELGFENSPWIKTPSDVSIAFNSEDIPVYIPADQPEESIGEIIVRNICKDTIAAQTVTVTVVPEPSAGIIILLCICAVVKRR